MIHNLRDAFGELVNENTWMDDTTRGLAKEKVVWKQVYRKGFYIYMYNKKEKLLFMFYFIIISPLAAILCLVYLYTLENF